jgi:hypothetical protein
MSIKYTTQEGKTLDINNLRQGTNFIAEVQLKANSTNYMNLNNLALAFNLPAGWEIQNSRLNGITLTESIFDYRDIKDDTAYTYFSMNQKENKVYKFMLTASYAGKYYLPSTISNAMYDEALSASSQSMWINVHPYENPDPIVCN